MVGVLEVVGVFGLPETFVFYSEKGYFYIVYTHKHEHTHNQGQLQQSVTKQMSGDIQ